MATAEEVRPFSEGYWQIILRRKGMIALFVAVTTAAVLVGSFLVTPIYEATTILHIREQRASVLGGDWGGGLVGLTGREDINTQVEILRSRSVLEPVILDLELGRGGPGDDQGRRAAVQAALDRLRREMSVQHVPNTRLVRLSVRSPDAALAAKTANAIAGTFIAKNLEAKREEADAVLAFVSGQVDQVRDRLNETEDDLLAYKRREKIGILDQEAKLKVERLAQLEASRQEVEVGLDVLATRIAVLMSQTGRPASPEALDADVRSLPAVSGLESRLAALQSELAGLEARGRDASAEIARLEHQIDRLREEIRSTLHGSIAVRSSGALGSAIQMQLADYESQRLVLEARRTALRNLIGLYERDVDRLPTQEITLVRLERAQRISSELYAALMRAKNEAQVEGASQIPNVEVVDPAVSPLEPIRPRRKQSLVMGLVAGMILGALFAVLLEVLQQRIHSEEEIRQVLGLSVLGSIPRFKTNGAAHRNAGTGERPVFFNRADADIGVTEAFRLLAANIRLLDPNGELRTIVITSPTSGDGKTTVAANLALALAAQQETVVLVDADFRVPRVHEVFGLPEAPGISDMLDRGVAREAVVNRIGAEAALDVLTNGSPAAGSPYAAAFRVAAAIEKLRAHYDRIVLDVPPVLGVTDALVAASVADATVLVLRLGEVHRRALTRTREMLTNARVRTIGGVLNCVDPREIAYGYGSYHYYRREGA